MSSVIPTLTLSGAKKEWVVMCKGGIVTVIYICDKRAMVVSGTYHVANGKPFIPYVYEGNSKFDVYEKYLHLIGKLTLKSYSSNYFSTPVFIEHCVNGCPGSTSTEQWEQIAVEICEKYCK